MYLCVRRLIKNEDKCTKLVFIGGNQSVLGFGNNFFRYNTKSTAMKEKIDR